jgi:hypothetical protein
MTKHANFRLTADYVAFFCFFYSIVYFMWVDGVGSFKRSKWDDMGEPSHFGHSYMVTPLIRSRLISDFSYDVERRWRKTSLLTHHNQSVILNRDKDHS